MPSSDKKSSSTLPRRLATDAMLLSAALILSYLEAILPLQLPVFGFKLGLANIAIVLASYRAGRSDALVITLLRVFITSLLFGSVTSFCFSLAGGLLAWGTVALTKPLYGKISLVGVSVSAAAAHNLGQTLAACLLFTSIAPASFLGWLFLLSVPAGILTGLLGEAILRILKS